MIARARSIAAVLAPGILFLLAWEMAVRGNPRLEFLFASPSLIFTLGVTELSASAIWNDAWVTLI